MIAKDTDYKNLLFLTQQLDKNISDSHDVVSYWMVNMNKTCGKYMADNKCGIFRSTVKPPSNNSSVKKIYKELIEPLDELNINLDDVARLDGDTRRVISNWNNLSGQYTVYSENSKLYHESMHIYDYIHITSPIRRLVDLLNQMLFIGIRCGKTPESFCSTNISNSALKFIDKWLNKIDYINITMRSIRKIQTDCEIIQKCYMNPDLINSIHTGVVFDKEVKDGQGNITYMVWLEKIKLLSRITTYMDVENLTKIKFKIYLFEDDYKRKIRLKMHTYESSRDNA